nr:hypothetical protein CFP56_68677 [Quercus suber]
MFFATDTSVSMLSVKHCAGSVEWGSNIHLAGIHSFRRLREHVFDTKHRLPDRSMLFCNDLPAVWPSIPSPARERASAYSVRT